MIYSKTDPVGIDFLIDKYQNKIHEFYASFDFDVYPRIYDIEKSNKSFPAHYVSNNEYKEILLNDSKDGIVFFRTFGGDKIKRNLFATKIEVYFLLNVSKLKPNINHRADEEVKLEAYSLIDRITNREEIEISKDKEAISDFNFKIEHMQPYYLLKFSFEKNYTI